MEYKKFTDCQIGDEVYVYSQGDSHYYVDVIRYIDSETVVFESDVRGVHYGDSKSSYINGAYAYTTKKEIIKNVLENIKRLGIFANTLRNETTKY